MNVIVKRIAEMFFPHGIDKKNFLTGQQRIERVRGTATIGMQTDEILSITRGSKNEKNTHR